MTDEGLTGTRDLRRFGLLFGGLGLALAGYWWWQNTTYWWAPALWAALFAGTGILAPSLLRPLHAGWMKFAQFLGWLNTRILLTLFFYMVITPVAIILKVFRKELLEEYRGKPAATYWKRRPDVVVEKSRYENLF